MEVKRVLMWAATKLGKRENKRRRGKGKGEDKGRDGEGGNKEV